MASLPRNHPGAVLRSGGAGGDHPAGTDCGEDDAPVHAAAAEEGGGDVSASFAGAGAAADAGGAAVPGAAAADRDDGSELQRSGGGGVAARGGHAAIVAAHEGPGGEAAERDDAERHCSANAGRDCAGDQLVCAVRISGVARGKLCAAGVCVGVLQGEVSGGVHVRDSEQSADGVLRAGGAGEGCAAAWAAGAADRRAGVGLGVHGGA